MMETKLPPMRFVHELLAVAVADLLLILGILRLQGQPLSPIALSDGCTLVGILLLVVGLLRVVNRIGLFSSLRYGYRKQWEMIKSRGVQDAPSAYPTFADYLQAHPYKKNCWPYLIIAAINLAVAVVVL